MAQIEFYDGTSALAHTAQLSVVNGNLVIHANGQVYTVQAKDLNPTLSTPNGRRFIHLPNNMALEFHDNADAERLLDSIDAPHLKGMRWFDRHYQSWSFISGALAAFVCLVAGLYFFILPAVSNHISTRLPGDMLDGVSQQALTQMEEDGELKPSKLSKARQAELSNKFNQLKKPDTNIPFKLHFFSSPSIGPNAFALPSGDVVLLDELVELTTDDNQIMGVLAHELGHVAYRHTMRNIIQSSFVSFAVATWLGDYGSTVANFGAAAMFSGKYSRDFEREADDYAIKMLKMNNISPAALADFFVIMSKEEAKQAKEDEGKTDKSTPAATQDKNIRIGDVFSSHPPTQERIDTLRNAAAKK